VSTLPIPLAVGREAATIIALVALGVAGLVVSAGAWILLWRERRRPSR
jgi:hypothetical protein